MKKLATFCERQRQGSQPLLMPTAKGVQEHAGFASLSCDAFAPNNQHTSTLGKGGRSPLHVSTPAMLLACSKQEVILSKIRGKLFTTQVLLVSKCGEELPTTPQYNLREPTTASAMQQEEKVGSGYDPTAKVLPG